MKKNSEKSNNRRDLLWKSYCARTSTFSAGFANSYAACSAVAARKSAPWNFKSRSPHLEHDSETHEKIDLGETLHRKRESVGLLPKASLISRRIGEDGVDEYPDGVPTDEGHPEGAGVARVKQGQARLVGGGRRGRVALLPVGLLLRGGPAARIASESDYMTIDRTEGIMPTMNTCGFTAYLALVGSFCGQNIKSQKSAFRNCDYMPHKNHPLSTH